MKVTRGLLVGGLAAGGMLLALGNPASAHEWCDEDWDHHHNPCHDGCHNWHDWHDDGHVNVYDVDVEYEEDNESGLLGLDLL